MGTLRAGSYLRILGRTLLLAGALPLGCDQSDTGATQAAVGRVESAQRKHASVQAIAPSATPASLTPVRPADDGLDEFKQALARKLDPGKWLTRPATPQGGILHIPNGQAGHAAILVKNPDGTLRRECVSSSAEVSALVEEIRRGRAP
jgi:hypothetical protein